MRLVINRCKFCYANPQTCEWRKTLKTTINPIPLNITISHKCQEYFKCLSIDTRVEITLNEIVEIEFDEFGHYTYEWGKVGNAKGTIIIGTSGDFFLVKLDKPVTLNLPPRNETWDKIQPVKVEVIRKRGNDCKIITEEDQ